MRPSARPTAIGRDRGAVQASSSSALSARGVGWTALSPATAECSPRICSASTRCRVSSWRTSRRRSAAPMCSPTTSWRSTPAGISRCSRSKLASWAKRDLTSASPVLTSSSSASYSPRGPKVGPIPTMRPGLPRTGRGAARLMGARPPSIALRRQHSGDRRCARVENRRDRPLLQYQSGKRKVVVVIRERGGKTLPGVFASEVAALNFIRTRIAKGTEVYADEASAWNELHARFTLHRINHQEAYSLGGGIHSYNAERFLSRMRRAEIGHHHHLAGPYLIRFAQEASWREDHRRAFGQGDRPGRRGARPRIWTGSYRTRARDHGVPTSGATARRAVPHASGRVQRPLKGPGWRFSANARAASWKSSVR
jgi:hypothetical protein